MMQIRKRFLSRVHKLFFILFVVLFPAAAQIFGQRVCMPVAGYQDASYWRADLVFTGTVEKFTADEKTIPPGTPIVTDTYRHADNLVRFAVEKKYRGAIGEKIELASTFYFKEGEKYLVYAVAGRDGKFYQLDNWECGRPPVLLKDAGEDLEYAEELAAGQLGTRVFGFVFEDFQRLGTTPQRIPLAAVKVTIRNEKVAFTTETDETGKYIFKNIPPGEYKIAASMPKGLRESPALSVSRLDRGLKFNTVLIGESVVENLLRLGSDQKPEKYYRHWDSYNFVFTSLGSITGRIVGADGKVAPQQYVWLLSIVDGKADPNQSLQEKWTNPATGEFVFESLPKGDYVVVVNRHNCHTSRNPEYGRNFFPGVAGFNDAERIAVGENQEIKLKDFRLLPPLKERWFSGVVLAADKSPLRNAAVILMPAGNFPSECFLARVETKTDESGRFRLKGYEGYAYTIRAYIEPAAQNSPGLSSKIVEPPAAGDVENIELIAGPIY